VSKDPKNYRLQDALALTFALQDLASITDAKVFAETWQSDSMSRKRQVEDPSSTVIQGGGS
jgi:hypothetical protein